MKRFFDPETSNVVDGLAKCEATVALIHDFLSEATDVFEIDDKAWDPYREAFMGLAHIAGEVRHALKDITHEIRDKRMNDLVKIVEARRSFAEISRAEKEAQVVLLADLVKRFIEPEPEDAEEEI